MEKELEKLMKREKIKIELNRITKKIKDKVVLITGAGGSIGTELSKQIALCEPKLVLLLDFSENRVYETEMELLRLNKQINSKIIIANIREKNTIEEIIKRYQPNYIFHAAAHKHVHIMEEHPLEAIKNNILGTYYLMESAERHNVEEFIFISSDKAVKTVNIMGATKKICEMMIEEKNKSSNTNYISVRFGNVLESDGSVIPLFRQQIQNGGPVTVTDKRMTRFFMTIPEAVFLILEAFFLAEGGKTYILDMGKPVKIYDVAEILIREYGYTPNKEIKIIETGIRKGEKLTEELLEDDEKLTPTNHKQIYEIQKKEENKKILDKIRKLEEAVIQMNKKEIETIMEKCFKEYKLKL